MAITLNVSGMTCGHCVGSVTKALQAVPGVQKVSVSLDSGRAHVDGQANPEALVRAVEKEGYQAKVADLK